MLNTSGLRDIIDDGWTDVAGIALTIVQRFVK